MASRARTRATSPSSTSAINRTQRRWTTDARLLRALSPEEIAARSHHLTARGPAPRATDRLGALSSTPTTPRDALRIVLAARLARSIREYGHLAARIDPLGAPPPERPDARPGETHGLTDADLAALPASIVWPSAGAEAGTCLDAIERLRAIYSGTHRLRLRPRAATPPSAPGCATPSSRARFRAPLDAARQRAPAATRLTEVEGFERFLHRTFPGQKRFSIEGWTCSCRCSTS